MEQSSDQSRIIQKLADLYAEMDRVYHLGTDAVGLSCEACEDNCCTSYFQHHTTIEWAYLWAGLNALPAEVFQGVAARAEDYVKESRQILAKGLRPKILCPLNQTERCLAYDHRVMICRLHGVPSQLMMPNGTRRTFPGCFRAQSLCRGKAETPLMDRTNLFRKLVLLEREWLDALGRQSSRVNMTVAEMIVQKPLVV